MSESGSSFSALHPIDVHAYKTDSQHKLVNLANEFIISAIAESTRSTYGVAVRSYIRFCEEMKLECTMPITDANMCLWASYYATTEKGKLTFATIKTYTFGLAYMHTELGFNNWREQLSLFRRCMIGIKRKLGDGESKLKRLPITTELLMQMSKRLEATVYEHALYWAAATLATYGLLRMSEFCAHDSQNSQDPFKLLYLKQIQLYDKEFKAIAISNSKLYDTVAYFTIRLRSSKTDPFREGITIHISHATAVQAMINYLRKHPRIHHSNSYLLIQSISPSSEVPLSRTVMIEMTRKLLESMGHNSSLYHGHSFRRGGATSLAKQGVPDSVIQTLGRWHSECFKLYIDLPLNKLLDYNRMMG